MEHKNNVPRSVEFKGGGRLVALDGEPVTPEAKGALEFKIPAFGRQRLSGGAGYGYGSGAHMAALEEAILASQRYLAALKASRRGLSADHPLVARIRRRLHAAGHMV